jgi:hypothetical protein
VGKFQTGAFGRIQGKPTQTILILFAENPAFGYSCVTRMWGKYKLLSVGFSAQAH